MAAIPFPPPISLDEALELYEKAEREYHNIKQLDLWLKYKITDIQLYDSIEITPI